MAQATITAARHSISSRATRSDHHGLAKTTTEAIKATRDGSRLVRDRDHFHPGRKLRSQSLDRGAHLAVETADDLARPHFHGQQNGPLAQQRSVSAPAQHIHGEWQRVLIAAAHRKNLVQPPWHTRGGGADDHRAELRLGGGTAAEAHRQVLFLPAQQRAGHGLPQPAQLAGQLAQGKTAVFEGGGRDDQIDGLTDLHDRLHLGHFGNLLQLSHQAPGRGGEGPIIGEGRRGHRQQQGDHIPEFRLQARRQTAVRQPGVGQAGPQFIPLLLDLRRARRALAESDDHNPVASFAAGVLH